jgi:hypothetical protein
MMFKEYYLISPSQKLFDHLAGLRAEYELEISALDLDVPQVVFIERYDRSFFILIEESAIKLIFLGALWDRSREYINGQYPQLLATFLGDPPYDLRTFDEWWEIKNLVPPEDFSDLVKDISFDALDVLGQTDNSRLDDWLHELKESKKPDIAAE